MKVIVNHEALANTLGLKAGDEIDVKCKDGIPANREWRNRFRDAAIDRCITVVQSKSKAKSVKESS